MGGGEVRVTNCTPQILRVSVHQDEKRVKQWKEIVKGKIELSHCGTKNEEAEETKEIKAKGSGGDVESKEVTNANTQYGKNDKVVGVTAEHVQTAYGTMRYVDPDLKGFVDVGPYSSHPFHVETGECFLTVLLYENNKYFPLCVNFLTSKGAGFMVGKVDGANKIEFIGLDRDSPWRAEGGTQNYYGKSEPDYRHHCLECGERIKCKEGCSHHRFEFNPIKK